MIAVEWGMRSASPLVSGKGGSLRSPVGQGRFAVGRGASLRSLSGRGQEVIASLLVGLRAGVIAALLVGQGPLGFAFACRARDASLSGAELTGNAPHSLLEWARDYVADFRG